MDELEQVPNYPSPKFVFAHIVSPHKPYVFDTEGQFVTDISNTDGDASEQDTIHLYTDQITYINARMEEILETIIASSERPPIIVVQADHGTNQGSRMNILNAYYLPGMDPKLLYDTITPVNTFRLIFSQYFNLDLPLLDDRSYLSGYSDPFSVEEVINHCEP